MDKKERNILVVIAFVLMLCVGVTANVILTGYRYESGTVIGMSYTAGNDGMSVGQVNGQPASVKTISPEKYTLIINVNGKVESYTVSAEAYMKALNGQKVFQMKCNAVLCVVAE